MLAAAASAGGCGRASHAAGAGSTPAASVAAPETAADGTRTWTVEADDAMKFSVTQITARPGERLKVVLVNRGRQPKVAMGHNWVLLQRDTDVRAYAVRAAAAIADEYLPPALASQVVAHTRLLGPGERDEVTFTAPAEPGRYVYLCSFPGHYALGMQGVLLVEGEPSAGTTSPTPSAAGATE